MVVYRWNWATYYWQNQLFNLIIKNTIKGQASLMVSDQRSSIQVHQCVPPEVLYTGSPICSTRGPLYRFTNVFHQRSSTGSPMCSIRGPLSRFTSVFNQRSSIQVHQCVPPEVRYTGSPVCSTGTLRQVKKKGQFPGKMYLLTLKK